MSRTQLADPRALRRAAAGRRMNKAEAQQLTAQIRAAAGGLWRLVAEAYDRKAWQALGYESWKDYATQELEMSESRSYQLVDTGRVMRALAEVAGTEEVFEQVRVTARETARIKPHMSTFKRDVEKAIKAGAAMPEAVEQALQALPTKERKPDIVLKDGTVVIQAKRQPEPELPPIYSEAPAPRPRPAVAPALNPFAPPVVLNLKDEPSPVSAAVQRLYDLVVEEGPEALTEEDVDMLAEVMGMVSPDRV